MIVRELGFEMKAKPSERLKTEEELAKEEQARLQKLEVYHLWLRLFGACLLGVTAYIHCLTLDCKCLY